MTNTDWSDHTRAITAQQQRLDQAKAMLQLQVTQARFAGVPWSVIGASLGMTKQAAQQRFGASDEKLPGTGSRF